MPVARVPHADSCGGAELLELFARAMWGLCRKCKGELECAFCAQREFGRGECRELPFGLFWDLVGVCFVGVVKIERGERELG